jgi:hypothetical protein
MAGDRGNADSDCTAGPVLGGFPADPISRVRAVIDPTTAE